MSWNLFILLFILSYAGIVDSEYLGVPNAIKDFEVSESCGESCAKVIWRSFETDTVSFKVEFVPVHDGESFFAYANGSINEEWTFFGTPSFTKEFSAQVKGLKLNETYIVRVFALNEQGQSPPSPAVIFSLDSHRVPVQDRHFLPNAPQKLGLSLDFTNGTKVTWEKVKYREDQTYTMSPIEYIIRYGDNKNTSLWKELKTNETWIVLDDLKNGTVYSAYVVAQEENRTSNRSYTIPIMPGEDMTGLPEPVLTIEPADKNGVFAPGDSITLKCSVPPNTYTYAGIILRVGKEFPRIRLIGQKAFFTLKTTANKDVETAECGLSGSERGVRRSNVSWKVKETLEDENLQKNLVVANETLTSFKSI